MIQTINRIIDECADVEGLLIELDGCTKEEDILMIAHRIVAKRTEFNWLKLKIDEATKKESGGEHAGGTGEDEPKGK